MSPPRQVVISGVGVISPLGTSLDAFWQALCEGRSGVAMLPLLAETPLPVRFGAAVHDFDGRQFVTPRKALKVMSREIQFGFAAATQALEDARLDASALDPDRFGVLFGSEMFYCEPQELVDPFRRCVDADGFHIDRWDLAVPQFFPLWMLKYLPNMAACHIGIAIDARGPNNTITLGEASSLLAVMEAMWVIQRGHADVMLAGGTGSRLSLTPMLYRGDTNLSHRGEDPARASRPFDMHRDGMVNGEGAAALVLESEDHARARGVDRPIRLLGWSSTCGPRYQPLDLSRYEAAVRRGIQAALERSTLAGDELGHVNAHGLGTRADDPIEARAIQQCVGDVPVTAPKSFFGNCGAGGGAIELVVSVLALRRGRVPGTLNYDVPDPDCPVNVLAGAPAENCAPTALVLNQSGTGQAAALVIGR